MPTEAPSFDGLRVAAFESRRADEMARLIEKLGGIPSVSPSMREVALEKNSEAIDFANRVITGQIDIIIFMTGVGIRHLVEQIERYVDRDRFLTGVADITTLVRGPKPIAALKKLGISPTHCVDKPNTWREVLDTVDEHLVVANQTIGLQEYGIPNASLVAGLEARGARVECLKVYRWDLPEDTQQLEENIRAISEGRIDVALFTSSHQIVNMLSVAETMDLSAKVRTGFDRTVVASIGPTTSETLRDRALPVDLEPEHNKMGHLVTEAAARGAQLLRRKHQISASLHSGDFTAAGVDAGGKRPAWYDGPFMKACRLEKADRVPIWLMRQAGRYMAEYRAIREKTTFLELCKDPALCAEIMITAVNRLGVDAAIIFADLLPILEPMGMDLEFAQGEGPIIHNPIRSRGDVDRVIELESVDALHFVMETVRQTREGLPGDIPLLGFAGAPFTLASYAIEGGSSRNFLHTKTLMYRDQGAWDALMGRLVRAITGYLNAQIAAGAQAVQLFDTWVGCLSPEDFRRYVLPHSQKVIDGIVPGVPVIHFAQGNPALLPLLSQAGGTVLGIDWRVNLDEAWRAVGHDKAIQGNLDPLVLLTCRSEIRRRAGQILDQADGRAGHIFNLGHGVLQQTPVENAISLVDIVHELTSK